MHQTIIAIEGVDGSGKSTLCDLLAKELAILNIKIAKTPFGILSNYTNLTRPEGPFASFASYLLSNICVINQFKDHGIIILDRYILSTIVYHYEIKSKLGNDLFDILELSGLSKPALTILLEADISIIEKRMANRNENSKHHFTSSELKIRFDELLSNTSMQPWLGKKIKLLSEDPSDHKRIAKVILDFLASATNE